MSAVTTKKTLMKMGVFNKLRALNIYDDSGERLQPLSCWKIPQNYLVCYPRIKYV